MIRLVLDLVSGEIYYLFGVSELPFTKRGLVWNFGSFVFLAFFLEGCLLCSLLPCPLGVLMYVALNVLKIGDSGPGCKST